MLVFLQYTCNTSWHSLACSCHRRGMDILAVVQEEILPPNREVEELQIQALAAVLLVSVTVLDVAGEYACERKLGPTEEGNPSSSGSSSAAGLDSAQQCAQLIHVLHIPGHFDVVYPAQPKLVSPQVGRSLPSTQALSDLIAWYTRAVCHLYMNASLSVTHAKGLWPCYAVHA